MLLHPLLQPHPRRGRRCAWRLHHRRRDHATRARRAPAAHAARPRAARDGGTHDRAGVRDRRTHARGNSGRHSVRAALPARGGRQARPARGRDGRRARHAVAQRDARGDGEPRHHLAARAGGAHGPWRADERPRRALRCVADEPLGRRSAVRPGAAGGAAGAGDLYGFLVLGVSPHRALDDDYRAFLGLVAEHLALTIADARASEEERRGTEALAALDRQRAEMLARERAARADAERARRRFHDLVQGLDAILWEANPRTARFTFVSQRAEKLLGYPVERWMSEPQFWLSLLHPEDRERAVGLCRRAVEEGRDQELEYRLAAAGGTTVWMHDTIYVVRDRRGRMRKLRGFMTDISERKRREEERVRLLADMRHARREAEVANRVKDEFLATLSHELRTPLGAILLWARLLRGTPLDQATTARALEMIEQDAKALERIVGDILDVSRIITGKLGLQVGAVA